MFEPTLAAARARITAVNPAAYARSRNALDGAVTRLSPYITHGFVSLPEVLAGVAANHRVDAQHKFVFELGWRAYFRHVWQHRGDGILRSLHAGPLPEATYEAVLPLDIRQARTGLPVIDQAVRTLYATGYLHNHARMWLASYMVHLRKVHWRAGADWLLGHLLDGDLASNHLSWQWVAGTGSHKPYLFNADNVARYAPSHWHSPGSVIDTSYEALEALARQPEAVRSHAVGQAAEGVDEPLLSSRPPERSHAPRPQDIAGRDVWLVHPWALGDAPADLPEGCMLLGWWPTELHAAWPWSPRRWAFVGERLSALAPVQWRATSVELTDGLATARSVHTLAHPQVAAVLPACVQQRVPPDLFPDVDRLCPSFSSWWNRCTKGVKHLSDLPGMQALPAPLFTPL